tara:strand:- start:765 stop:1877 length:1113 start_codon:yes stop_codon:yes gene_type:complete
MDSLVENIKQSEIWKKIHSDEPVLDIMAYFKSKNIDYSSIESLIDYISSNHSIDKTLITCKFLTSIIMISKFPDDIIGNNKGETEEILHKKAVEIYQILVENKTENIHKKLVTFKLLFDEWKQADKLNQINLLCEMYYKYDESINEFKNKKILSDEELLDINKEITDTMDSEAKMDYINKARAYDKEQGEIYMKHVNNARNQILHQLKELTPIYKKCLYHYKFKNVTYDESVYKMVYTKMKHIYWGNIKRDIFELQKCDIFKHVVQDYIDILSAMKITQLDYSSLESLLDYELSPDHLEDACILLCETIVKLNKQLDSENYDEIYDMLIEKLHNNSKYITEIFKFCFDRLESIKKIKDSLAIKNNSLNNE